MGAFKKLPNNAKAMEVANILVGSFGSAAQAAEDKTYYDIRLSHTRIWQDRPDGPWLYVEQAVSTAMQKPYRQRIYRLVEIDDNQVRSDVYSLPGDVQSYVGAPAGAFKDIKPDQLAERKGCSIYLTKKAQGHWVGSTNESDCESSLRGSTYATSEVDLQTNLLTTWDRGFNKEGEQVWGAVKGPYKFDRL